jgi:bifunctional non-homologous end joining protein LigD
VAKATKRPVAARRATPVRRISATRRRVTQKSPVAVRGVSTVAGVRISHPDRLIYPDLGISKIALARYYDEIGDWIVPHVAGRPLTLVHCPAGLAAPCIYMKHAKAWGPNALRRVKIQEKTKVGEYLVADSIEAVVSLAQMGIVEIHTWNSTIVDIERPNRIVWDLDPGPEVSWKQVVEAAGLVRAVLKTLGLSSWVKTTGGRGLHVVVPITPARSVAECLEFSRTLSEVITRTDPQLYTTTFAKLGRDHKILIDYLRNNRTNTSICAYSPRARPGATVSMPLDWSELSASPEHWMLTTVPQHLQRLRADPWARYWTATQEISDASFAAIRGV